MSDAAPLEPTTDPLIGRTLAGRFCIEEPLAIGGMGTIYKARQEPLGRMVALKILGTGPIASPEFRERFILEASATAKLSHRNIVRVFDFGITNDGIHFIAMELIEGRPLIDVLRDEAPLEPGRALHIARQVVSALSAAHDKGIVHRDIKPSNILITTDGDQPDFVKVVDFGLVKVTDAEVSTTQTGVVLGSPQYMPPEQIEGLDETDERSDIYPVGILLFNMLTGLRPFKGKSARGLLYAHVHKPFPLMSHAAPHLDIPHELEAIVQRCVQKRPDDRFASMRELAQALYDCEFDEITIVPLGDDELLHLERLTTAETTDFSHGGDTTERQHTAPQQAAAMVGAFSAGALVMAAALAVWSIAFAWLSWSPPPPEPLVIFDNIDDVAETGAAAHSWTVPAPPPSTEAIVSTPVARPEAPTADTTGHRDARKLPPPAAPRQARRRATARPHSHGKGSASRAPNR